MNFRIYIFTSKIIYLFLLFLFVSSFTYHEPEYCKMVDRITKRYIKEFVKPRGLVLYCYGGAMMGDIQSITLSFASHATLNVDEARALYVELMEEYLCRINANEKIRPFLHNYPFEFSNIKLTLSFRDSKGHDLTDGHVALMYNNQELVYRGMTFDTKEFYSLHRELYIRAREIVRGY